MFIAASSKMTDGFNPIQNFKQFQPNQAFIDASNAINKVMKDMEPFTKSPGYLTAVSLADYLKNVNLPASNYPMQVLNSIRSQADLITGVNGYRMTDKDITKSREAFAYTGGRVIRLDFHDEVKTEDFVTTVHSVPVNNLFVVEEEVEPFSLWKWYKSKRILITDLRNIQWIIIGLIALLKWDLVVSILKWINLTFFLGH